MNQKGENKNLLKYLKQKNNVLQFDFMKYKQSQDYEALLKKVKVNQKYSPIKLSKIFEKKNQDPSLYFEDFLHFLKKNNLWNENESIRYNVSLYIKKYGPLKIFFLLKNKQYQEESIKQVLESISEKDWLYYALKNLRSKEKKLNRLDSIKKLKKAYQYLNSLGYPETIVEIALKNLN